MKSLGKNNTHQEYLPGAEPLFIEGSNLGCLLLHGAGGGTAWDLKEIAEYLHEQFGATVWLPSLSGFGTKPEDLMAVSFDQWMNDAQSGLERLKSTCEQVVILGHSYGGLLGLLLAANNENISALITWAAVYKIKDRRLGLLPILYKIPLVRRLIPQKFPFNPPESLIDQGWVGYSWMPVSIVHSITEGLSRLKRSISKVKCPTFIIQGSLDERVTDDSPHIIYRSISSSKKDIWIVEGGYHPLMQDRDLKSELFKRTGQFIEKVLKF